MQSFYRQLQEFMCNGQQAQTEKEKTLQELRKEQQRAKFSNWKEISEICQKQEKEENGEGVSTLSRNTAFRWLKQNEHLKLGRKCGKLGNLSLQLWM